MAFRQVVNNERGVALMMVLSIVAIVSVVAVEFTYLAQVNQRMAYDRLDQIKAHYLVKSAMKISLLRLKAFRKVSSFASGNKNLPIPAQMLDQIWSFPLIFPFPELPGMSSSDKNRIQEFMKESGLNGGQFTARIESESSKYNLNMILADYTKKAQETEKKEEEKKSDQEGTTTNTPTAGNNETKKEDPKKFDAEAAREGLKKYLQNILNTRMENDEDFAEEYQNLDFDDLMANIFAWADYQVELPNTALDSEIAIKRAPFYSLSELHMVPGMDDQLYDLFTPSLTVSSTAGININTMQEPTLLAVLPGITPEDVEEFFRYRDDPEENHRFKDEEAFYKYLQEVNLIGSDATSLADFKRDLDSRNIRLIVDETEFRIVAQATFNQAERTLEAIVTLEDDQKKPNEKPKSPNTNNTTSASQDPGRLIGSGRQNQDSGLRITFLSIK